MTSMSKNVALIAVVISVVLVTEITAQTLLCVSGTGLTASAPIPLLVTLPSLKEYEDLLAHGNDLNLNNKCIYWKYTIRSSSDSNQHVDGDGDDDSTLRRISVVDDNDIVRIVTKGILVRWDEDAIIYENMNFDLHGEKYGIEHLDEEAMSVIESVVNNLVLSEDVDRHSPISEMNLETTKAISRAIYLAVQQAEDESRHHNIMEELEM